MWVLLNYKTKQRVNQLSLAQAKEHLSKEEDLSIWFCWKPGFQDWKKVTDVTELVPEIMEPPSFDFSRVMGGGGSLKAVPLVPVEEHNNEERRVHPRYDVAIEVILVTENKTFRTTTKNISLGGLCLNLPMPWKEVECCEVILKSPRGLDFENLQFTSKVIRTFNNRNRIQFEDLDVKSKSRLSFWIQQILGKTLKKTA